MTNLEAHLVVETREVEKGVVIELSGDLVITNHDGLREAVEDALERHRDVIVSCAGLDHVDTPSLGLLVRLGQRCREQRRDFAVAELTSRFPDLVSDIRLEQGLRLVDTVEEGLGGREV